MYEKTYRFPYVSGRPPSSVATHCCASVFRLYDGRSDSCQRGEGRAERVMLTSWLLPPSSSADADRDPDQRVSAVCGFPKLAVACHPRGLPMSGPPRVSASLVVRALR